MFFRRGTIISSAMNEVKYYGFVVHNVNNDLKKPFCDLRRLRNPPEPSSVENQVVVE